MGYIGSLSKAVQITEARFLQDNGLFDVLLTLSKHYY